MKQPIVISHCVEINSDHTWQLFVHGHKVDIPNCMPLRAFDGTIVTADKLNEVLAKISTMNVCAGHPEKRFLEVCRSRKDQIQNHSGDVVAYRDDYCPVLLNGELYPSTVRSTKCELLVNDVKCEVCKLYRSVLRSMHNRSLKHSSEKNSHISSHTNYRYLKTPERQRRMIQLKSHLDQSRREVETLKSKIQQLQEKQGVNVDEPLDGDLKQIMEESSSKVYESHPPGSFLRLFWDQQLEAIKTKDRRQLRWHPMMVKWCLNLKLMSGRAYNALRSTLVLPSERTLRDYTHYFESKPGFDSELDKQLMKEAQVDTIQDFQKYTCLVLDEVRVKEGLVYDKHSLQVIGFVNVGDINNELLRFERAQTTDSQELPTPPIANHMLVFMVRGIFSRLEFPYVQFPCASTSGDVIFPLVWECIKRLEACGLKVIATTADGASSNRKFFKMHKQASGTGGDVVHKTINVYSPEKRPLFFISDVPHLIKTVRNCWSNSFAHTCTRTLKVSTIIDSRVQSCITIYIVYWRDSCLHSH